MLRPITHFVLFCLFLFSFFLFLGYASSPLPVAYGHLEAGLCDSLSADTVPPLIHCPADTAIQLEPWACSVVYSFAVTATDNCDPAPQIVQTDTTGLTSGDFFYEGAYVLSFEAVDSSGNSSDCSFSVEVQEIEPSIIACRDNLEFYINAEGYFHLTADMLLDTSSLDYGCVDDYEILVQMPYAGGDTLFCNQLNNGGESLVYRLEDTETGNVCWGSFTFFDTLPPVFDCPTDTVFVPCTMPLEEVPPPPVADNCTPVNLSMTEYAYNDNCDSLRLFEHLWVAADTFGNVSGNCSQFLWVYEPELSFPPDLIWTCEQVLAHPNLLEAGPLHDSLNFLTGADTLDGRGISDTAILQHTAAGETAGTGGMPCFISGVSYQDSILAGACENAYTLRRIWTVTDWCHYPDPGSQKIDTQYIYVVDETAPLVLMDSFTVSANILATDTTPCLSQGFLPPPGVTDCSAYELRIFTPLGEAVYVNGLNGLDGGLIPAPGLELGSYQITYEVEDACGNLTSLEVAMEVVDDVAPVAQCQTDLLWVLPNGDADQIPALQFDSLSSDNCCLDSFEVRRWYGDCYGLEDDFGPEIEVCCSDASAGPVAVMLRVYDCAGNYNDCMTSVQIQVDEDSSLPLLTYCPESVTISCSEYLQTLAVPLQWGNESILDSLHGTAMFIDNCSLNVVYEWTMDINTCAEGEIVRTWTATDGNNIPVVCEQVITVEHVEDYTVVFPPDSTFVCVNGQLPDFGEPQVFNDDCELVGVSYVDEVYHVVPDACYKIVRTWKLINWCTYPNGLMYQYDQIIKVVDDEGPLVDIDDQTYCISGSDCHTDLVLPEAEVTDCSEVTVSVYAPDLLPYATLDPYVYVNVPPGVYSAIYTAEDACGNATVREISVNVLDCESPVSACANDLIVEIGPTGLADLLSAFSIDAGSSDNCSTDLQFSFSEDVNDAERQYDCSDLNGNFQEEISVELWVTDEAGNQDFCTTLITLIDSGSVCDYSTHLVAGKIETEIHLPVPGVQVSITGYNGYNLTTNQQGEYEQSLAGGFNYTITPFLDEDVLNGVSTFDLVLISRHILGVDLLDSPYKIIAADVNHSGNVSTLDVVVLQKVILGLLPDFPDNTSWRFVDAGYVFPDPANPWFAGGFPESIFLFNLQYDELFADFVAVKVGDVNNTVALFAGEQAEVHSGEPLFLQTADREVSAGEHFNCSFRLSEEDLAGLQASLHFDPQALAFERLHPVLTGEECFGFRQIEEGLIAVSWPLVPALDLEDEVLFTLEFEALRSGRLSEMLSLSGEIVRPKAYRSGGQPLPLILQFGESSQNLNLYARPNPFRDYTTLHFYLPKGGRVRLSISDARGRLLWQREGDYEAGLHEEKVQGLGASGLLFCTLESPFETSTIKLAIKNNAP